MPRYQNNKQLKTAASLTTSNLMERGSANIVGTNEWVARRNLESYLQTGRQSVPGPTRNSIYGTTSRRRKKRGPSENQIVRNEQLIDNILNFTYKNGWQQIEGGVHDKRWVNTRHYPEKIFNTSSIKEYSTGETHYFPVAGTENDPAGVAFNYHGLGNGQHFYIRPNKWDDLTQTRRGKRRAKYMEYVKRRLKKKAEFEEHAGKVKDQFVKDASVLLARGNMAI
jgi:hypothetical protein